MKNKLFMYLFFFALLFIIYQYMNEKSIFETQEQKITSLRLNKEKAEDSIQILSNRIADLNYFTLLGNENAMVYLENLGYEAASVESFVGDAIYDRNLEKGGNPLIPFEGMSGPMMINKIKFLNHKWLQADFSDGKFWGEVLMEYSINEDQKLEINTLASLLYPID